MIGPTESVFRERDAIFARWTHDLKISLGALLGGPLVGILIGTVAGSANLGLGISVVLAWMGQAIVSWRYLRILPRPPIFDKGPGGKGGLIFEGRFYISVLTMTVIVPLIALGLSLPR